MVNHYDVEAYGTIAEISVRALQPVGAPATMGFKILVGGSHMARMGLLDFAIGPDNYGAARDIVVAQYTSNSAVNPYLLYAAASIDNQILTGPEIRRCAVTTTASTVGSLGVPRVPHWIPSSNYITVTGASLANTETLYGVFHVIIIGGCNPTLSAIGTGVTLNIEIIKWL